MTAPTLIQNIVFLYKSFATGIVDAQNAHGNYIIEAQNANEKGYCGCQ
jgi:hypothetical protein